MRRYLPLLRRARSNDRTKATMTSTRTVSKPQQHDETQRSSAGESATIRVRSFELPPSSLVDAHSHELLQHWAKRRAKLLADIPGHWADRKSLRAVRDYYDQHYFPALVAKAAALYDVCVEKKAIGGVGTEVFVAAGAQAGPRVLINLHGGGFTMGASCSRLESIPIAALAKTTVVSVDYRLAPEHRFPAASDDVVCVYRALLETHQPRDIAMFGCSAGALLVSQTVSRLQAERLPQPGAIALLFGGASYWADGDSGHVAGALAGESFQSLREHPYFERANPHDPLVAPLRSDEVLAGFPPSLLVSATRDVALSSVVHTHSRLAALGVAADLRVWEGLHHAFHYDLDLPQSLEVHRATVDFFARHLGNL